MKLDIIYLACNRLEFTQESFRTMIQNTDWSKVSRLIIYDDGSIDGTFQFLAQEMDKAWPWKPDTFLLPTSHGSPVDVMLHYLRSSPAEVFVKIDNDTMLPPGWLSQGMTVMEQCPGLHLLGIEHPMSRRGQQLTLYHEMRAGTSPSYARCDAIGGIGFMRSEALMRPGPNPLERKPETIYSGFTEWQLRHPEIMRGWLCPAVKVFLLDRIPIEPWKSLSLAYIGVRWQRPYTNYTMQQRQIWDWWNPVRLQPEVVPLQPAYI